VIGVDLGGSNVRALIGDRAGAPLAERAEETSGGTADDVLAQVAGLCRGVAGEAGVGWRDVAAVAVGVPGVVADGGLRLAPHLPPFGGVDLRAALEEALRAEVLVDNDVNMATEAERRHGLGREVDDFVFIAVGTGIGMGIVAGGRLQRGATGAAGEIASLPVPGAGGPRPLEELAGGAPMAARYGGSVSALDLYEAAARGDARATTLVDEQAQAIAVAVLAVQSVLDPALVVMGGGIGTRPDVLRRVRRRLEGLTARPPRVQTSPLGERAGLVGAVEVARRGASRERLGGPVDG
jgi:predicted NBD/HSP70 family sugar kinase